MAMVVARHNPGVALAIEMLSTGGGRMAGPLTVDLGEGQARGRARRYADRHRGRGRGGRPTRASILQLVLRRYEAPDALDQAGV